MKDLPFNLRGLRVLRGKLYTQAFTIYAATNNNADL
jgi:hypothetical protein